LNKPKTKVIIKKHSRVKAKTPGVFRHKDSKQNEIILFPGTYLNPEILD
jgi:hypothetical protein